MRVAGFYKSSGSNKEYASLYNLYWLVRLSTLPAFARASVYALGGINPGLSVFAQ